MAVLRLLAIAVATGRIGYVFFKGKELCHWGLSRKASRSPKSAAAEARKWISLFRPDVVVTEDVRKNSRKGDHTIAAIEAVAKVASDVEVSDVVVPRRQTFENKYEEAKALAARFPDILPWKPQRPRIWESEPRNMIYFEALALALEILDPRREQLA